MLEAGGSGQRTTIQLGISETFVAQNEKEKERSPSAGESGQRTTIQLRKIPGKMEVAPRYTLLTLFLLFIIFKLLYTA